MGCGELRRGVENKTNGNPPIGECGTIKSMASSYAIISNTCVKKTFKCFGE